MINHFRLVWLWILMSNICRRSLSHLRRLLVSWDMFQQYKSSLRFLLHPRDASHRYPCLCFFQRGGTSFRGHGSTYSSEQSLFNILLLGVGAYSVSLPLIILYCIYWMYVITGGSWLLHPSMHPFSSLFLGKVFSHVVFPSFHALWEMCICILYMGTYHGLVARTHLAFHPSICELKTFPKLHLRGGVGVNTSLLFTFT